jgi:hypothetical protein
LDIFTNQVLTITERIMQFDDIFIFKEDRFSVGIEKDSKKYYLSIPVSNGLVEYEEYYEIDKAEFESFSRSLDGMRKIASLSRERKNDSRLLQQPGKKRGSPI